MPDKSGDKKVINIYAIVTENEYSAEFEILLPKIFIWAFATFEKYMGNIAVEITR